MFNDGVEENEQNYRYAEEQRSDINKIGKFIFVHKLAQDKIKTD